MNSEMNLLITLQMLVRTQKFGVFDLPRPPLQDEDLDKDDAEDDDVEIYKYEPMGPNLEAEALYSEIYKDYPYDDAAAASHRDREENYQFIGKPNLIYGELGSGSGIRAMELVLQAAVEVSPHLASLASRKFYDLGSGSGRCVGRTHTLRRFMRSLI